jgi:serine/threonine protein kinase
VGDKISEGGYAIVYEAKDSASNEIMALKRIYLKDKETEQVMCKEVKNWRSLGEHPNIVKFIDAAIHNTHKGNYLYILSEYCKDGHVWVGDECIGDFGE